MTGLGSDTYTALPDVEVEAEVAEMQMKKLSLALGKSGLILSLILPTIGLAEYATYNSAASYATTAASGYSTDQETEKLLNLYRANKEAQEALGVWNKHNDTKNAHVKAQGAIRKRAEAELDNQAQQIEGMKKAGKNFNASGLDAGVAAMQSALNPNGMHKECRVGLDFGGLQRSSQQAKNDGSLLASNMTKEAGKQEEDIIQRTEKARAKELARLEALDKGNPEAEEAKKQFEQLQGALKGGPEVFVKYIKNAAEVAAKSAKQAGLVTRGMLLNQDGLMNLLAKVAKDKELLNDFATQLSTFARNGVGQMAVETENIVNTAKENCEYNRSKMMNLKNQVVPAIEQSQFHSAKKKQRVKQMFAKAEKAECNANVDVTTLMNLASTADQQIRAAAADGDALAMVNAFNQSMVTAGDQLAQLSKNLRPLKKDCDETAKFVDFLNQDSGTQELKEASKSGMDINQALAQSQDPNAAQGGAPQAPRSNVPALGSPIVTTK